MLCHTWACEFIVSQPRTPSLAWLIPPPLQEVAQISPPVRSLCRPSLEGLLLMYTQPLNFELTKDTDLASVASRHVGMNE